MNKRIDFKVDGSSVKLEIDPNKDGEKLLNMKLSLKEAVQELFARGVRVQGQGAFEMDFEDGSFILKVDTDQDGENLLEMRLDLSEALDEGMDAFFKKDEE